MIYVSAMLKEVSKSPHEMILHPEMDATRLALYPTLDYTGLYSALESLLHSASSINTGLQGTYILDNFRDATFFLWGGV